MVSYSVGDFFSKMCGLSYIKCESKKTIHLTFYQNFCKCGPIYKILSLLDSSGNFVHILHKDSPPHLKYVSTLSCETCENWNCC